ncbi:TIGR01777 family protein [Magnetovirga frankeli]|uniref:TIGR01777 family oxidoreductase n=1 Tax=Magnetovirga frankeli TaxID=947516 RepID=UPI0012933F92|nr:TIGR01777 family protein [gamma proteobacterium SS-5]
MNIALSGSSGFVGSHLASALEDSGHRLIRLGRADFAAGSQALAARIQGCQAVIHLAGEPISKRWSAAYKQRMISSRVDTTRSLVQAMKDAPPALFISTSAIGAFRQQRCYSEEDAPDAQDFLGQLSRDWEAEALAAEALGVRTLIFRLGLVLGHDGGLLKQLLPPFMLGLGGPVGSGSQHFSWIHIDDLVTAYLHALKQEQMQGVYHLCAPNPLSNAEFSCLLGQVLRRPALPPVPPSLLRLAFGEGADVMCSGQCVRSVRLEPAGFAFRYPQLRPALAAVVRSARDTLPLGGLLTLGARLDDAD